MKKRLQHLSIDESSVSSSGSESSYDSDDSRSYGSYTETERDDTTMYTDASRSFVSIGYNTTQSDEDDMSDSMSEGETDAEMSPRGFAERLRSGFGGSPRSPRSPRRGTNSSSQASSRPTRSFDSTKSPTTTLKRDQSKLGELLAEKARMEKEGGAGESADGPTEAGDKTTEGDLTNEDTINSSRSKTSTSCAEYLKKMEGFTVKNPDHQLVIQVEQHGNVEKLSLQVRRLTVIDWSSFPLCHNKPFECTNRLNQNRSSHTSPSRANQTKSSSK